jgi:thiosulfate reductase / polysulfide reductase chain A
MPMEITGYADVVLPECTYLERWDDLRVAQGRTPNIAIRMPAAEPKYNTKPAYWMAKELVEKNGVGRIFCLELNRGNARLAIETKVGSSLEEMKRIGVKNFPRQYGR